MTTSKKSKVTFHSGKHVYFFVSVDEIQAKKNVIQYCFGRFGVNTIQEIKTRSENYHNKGYHWVLNYSPFFEHAYDNHIRVEAVNPKGYEDYTGYGCGTEGKVHRFYIGRSTGWIPIYLEILKSNSTGGSALFIPSKAKRKFSYL